MSSIVERLQRDALDSNVSVSSLLRQVKLIAAKLKLDRVEGWVENELSGYASSEIPDYRRITGAPRAHNPFHGWIPIVIEDHRMMEAISTRDVGQKVSELEDLLKDTSATTLQIPFPPRLVAQLNESTSVPLYKMALLVSRASVVGIIDAVRNKILDWAIELEKSDIKGSEISFTEDEQSRARQPNVTMNIGTIGNFVGNLGTGNSSGNITVGNIAIEQVRDLIEQIKTHEEALTSSGVSSNDLQAHLDRLEEALSKKEPDQNFVTSLLYDLRTVISKAATNVVTSGVLHLLNQMLGIGVPSV